MRKAQSKPHKNMSWVKLSPFLLFILQHKDMHTYTADHNRLDLQNAEADKVELTCGEVAFNPENMCERQL